MALTSLIRCELIPNVMGSDMRVVNAARRSFGKWKDEAQELSKGDISLIRYLAEHEHSSPFMHPMLSFNCEAPLPIARQLWKHHIGLASQEDNVAWNEDSRRYIDAEPDFYMPKVWREKADNKKQGSGGPLPEEVQIRLTSQMMIAAHASLRGYNKALEMGLCPEQARFFLIQGAMVGWVWTGSLMAFLRICKLRLDSHAQVEAQEFGKLLMGHCSEHFPVSTYNLMQPVKELS